MATIQDNDHLLINRAGQTYKITGEDLINSVVDPLEVTVILAPIDGYTDTEVTAVPVVSGGKQPDGGFIFSYQWVTADDAAGTNKANIAGETGATFTPTSAQVGEFLGCVVSTTDALGTSAEGEAYIGPIQVLAQAPVIADVVVSEIYDGANRFTDKEFPYVTTMAIDGDPDPTYEVKAKLSGTTFDFDVRSDVITDVERNGVSQGIPYDTKLTLASPKDLADFNVGDTVKMVDDTGAVASYAPVTSEITNVSEGVSFIRGNFSPNFVTRDNNTNAILPWQEQASNFGPVEFAFDGDDNTFARGVKDADGVSYAYGEFTPDPPITINSTLSICNGQYSYFKWQFEVNGKIAEVELDGWDGDTDINNHKWTWRWLTTDIFAGETISSSNPLIIKCFHATTNAVQNTTVYALAVDGSLLIDNAAPDPAPNPDLEMLRESTILTLTDETDVKYFRPGDLVQGNIVSSSKINVYDLAGNLLPDSEYVLTGKAVELAGGDSDEEVINQMFFDENNLGGGALCCYNPSAYTGDINQTTVLADMRTLEFVFNSPVDIAKDRPGEQVYAVLYGGHKVYVDDVEVGETTEVLTAFVDIKDYLPFTKLKFVPQDLQGGEISKTGFYGLRDDPGVYFNLGAGGATVVSVDESVPSITVDGGDWYADPANGGDGSGETDGDTEVTCVSPLKAPTDWKVEVIDTDNNQLSLSHATPNDNAQVWVANDNQAGTDFYVEPTNAVPIEQDHAWANLQIINNKAQVTGIQQDDPGFLPVPAKDYSIQFPSLFATGNEPDVDLPKGTCVAAIVAAENSEGRSVKESNCFMPIDVNPDGAAGPITATTPTTLTVATNLNLDTFSPSDNLVMVDANNDISDYTMVSDTISNVNDAVSNAIVLTFNSDQDLAYFRVGDVVQEATYESINKLILRFYLPSGNGYNQNIYCESLYLDGKLLWDSTDYPEAPKNVTTGELITDYIEITGSTSNGTQNTRGWANGKEGDYANNKTTDTGWRPYDHGSGAIIEWNEPISFKDLTIRLSQGSPTPISGTAELPDGTIVATMDLPKEMSFFEDIEGINAGQVSVVNVDAANNKITVDGGEWRGSDSSGNLDGDTEVTYGPVTGTGVFQSADLSANTITLSVSNDRWIDNNNRLSKDFYVRDNITVLNADNPKHVAMQQAIADAFTAFPQKVNERRTAICL